MDITVKLEAQNLADAMNNLATAITQIINARAQMLAGPAPETVAEPRTKKEKSVVAEAVSTIACAAVQDTVVQAPADLVAANETPTALTYTEHVAPTMGKLLAEKGVGVVKDLLAQFGAKKGGELQTDQLAAVLVKAQELLHG